MEASLAAQAAESGLPTPRVFCVDRVSDRAVMLLEYVPGTAGDDPGIDPDHVWRSLGAFACAIHSIQADGFGERFGETIPTHTSWEGMLEYNIRRLAPTDALTILGLLNKSSANRVRQRFEHLALTKFSLGLSHGDLAPRNVIVDPQGECHLLDWGCAIVSIVPHHDLAEIIGSSLGPESREFAAFLDGYGMTRKEFEAIADDVGSIRLLELIDKLHWALDRGRSRIEHYKVEVRKQLMATGCITEP